MEGLFTLLLYAGLFYFLMRFGCGAHTAHGHHKKKVVSAPTIDPVCGARIEEEQGYGKLQQGHLFRFCSKECLDEFDNNPDKYVEKSNIVLLAEKERKHDS
jgi:YHS domain-containing protein